MEMNPPIARSTDPATSHEAAEALTGREAIQEACLRIIRENPGLTRFEVAEKAGLAQDKVWRRISDLQNAGLIYPGAPRMAATNRMQRTWYAADEGCVTCDWLRTHSTDMTTLWEHQGRFHRT